jgi:geranylgeranyl pyrophosphate synthase
MGVDAETERKLHEYGLELGLAFQIQDDVLDFTKNLKQLGKPSLNDLKSGLTTAPVLFAMNESQGQQLKTLAQRKYAKNGDIETTFEIIKESNGILKSSALALRHLEQAFYYLRSFSNSKNNTKKYLQALSLKSYNRQF